MTHGEYWFFSLIQLAVFVLAFVAITLSCGTSDVIAEQEARILKLETLTHMHTRCDNAIHQ